MEAPLSRLALEIGMGRGGDPSGSPGADNERPSRGIDVLGDTGGFYDRPESPQDSFPARDRRVRNQEKVGTSAAGFAPEEAGRRPRREEPSRLRAEHRIGLIPV